METCFSRNTVTLQEVLRGTKLPMSLPVHIKSPQIQGRFDEDLHRHKHVTLKKAASPTEKQNIWLIQKLQFTDLQLVDTPLCPPLLHLADFSLIFHQNSFLTFTEQV